MRLVVIPFSALLGNEVPEGGWFSFSCSFGGNRDSLRGVASVFDTDFSSDIAKGDSSEGAFDGILLAPSVCAAEVSPRCVVGRPPLVSLVARASRRRSGGSNSHLMREIFCRRLPRPTVGWAGREHTPLSVSCDNSVGVGFLLLAPLSPVPATTTVPARRPAVPRRREPSVPRVSAIVHVEGRTCCCVL